MDNENKENKNVNLPKKEINETLSDKDNVSNQGKKTRKVFEALKKLGKGALVTKGVTDIVTSYLRGNIAELAISVVGTTADLVILKCPEVKGVTPVATTISVACKGTVEFSRTGRVSLPSFKD